MNEPITKYIVKVDYKSFTFTDRQEALDFADVAFEHADRPGPVEIEIIREVPENE